MLLQKDYEFCKKLKKGTIFGFIKKIYMLYKFTTFQKVFTALNAQSINGYFP